MCQSVTALGEHFGVCPARAILSGASGKAGGRQVLVTVHASQVQDISVYFTLADSWSSSSWCQRPSFCPGRLNPGGCGSGGCTCCPPSWGQINKLCCYLVPQRSIMAYISIFLLYWVGSLWDVCLSPILSCLYRARAGTTMPLSSVSRVHSPY